ncbi:hypothetical protein FQA47_025123 [Oryzias melastigma]|uniref:Uncharacterized protein n=1 Tax=Oryzias melastigma TaxID=30732 RepID=A0A834F391_ORYME|nr:hypothetical protein FQA47_025123 [Oryzias melastigma]
MALRAAFLILGTIISVNSDRSLPLEDGKGVIIGGAVAGVILIVVCVTLGIVLFKRKRADKEKPSPCATPLISGVPPMSSQTSLTSSTGCSTKPLMNKSHEAVKEKPSPSATPFISVIPVGNSQSKSLSDDESTISSSKSDEDFQSTSSSSA